MEAPLEAAPLEAPWERVPAVSTQAPASSPLGEPRLPRLGKRVQLGEEIAAYVRELIVSGQLRTGDPIQIDGLARHLETSATPVREALLVLLGEGFVQLEPRRGFRVAPLSRRDVEDIFHMQSAIAGELASRAAETATEAFLEQISALQDEMRKAGASSDDASLEALNFQFHRLINRSADSPKLTWLLRLVVRYVPRLFYATIDGWHDASLRDHSAIIDALRRNDGAAARTAMTSHIQHAGRLLISHLEQRGFWSTSAEEEQG